MEFLWLAAYPVAWVALFAGSSAYWFLPAGLRMGTLWLLPRRRWGQMALLEWATILALSLARSVFASPWALALTTVGPWCIYAGVVRLFGTRELGSPTPQSMVRLLLCALLAATLNSQLLTWSLAIDGDLIEQPYHSMAFFFALGDLVGAVVVAPLLLLGRDQLYIDRKPWRSMLGGGLVLLPALMVLAFAASPLRTVLRYPVVLALFPLFWVAFRGGWRVAAVATTLLSAAVYVVGRITPPLWEPGQLQLLLAATGSAALLLGLSTDALRTQGRALEATVGVLSMRTRQLTDVANRLTSQQEEDRRRIGVELHDQLGQDMTAIATRVRLVERTTDDPAVREGLKSVESLIGDAHGHLRSVIHQLHPLVLDRFGLVRALSDGPLAEMAREHGVAYRCEFHGDIDGLEASVASALYRICQEATTNGVRHGCGNQIRIRLARVPEVDATLLTVQVEDAAGALSMPAERVGLGLQGIRDRAHALGAHYRFDPDSGHPRHWLQVRLPD